jgi:hypothetical protein
MVALAAANVVVERSFKLRPERGSPESWRERFGVTLRFL